MADSLTIVPTASVDTAKPAVGEVATLNGGAQLLSISTETPTVVAAPTVPEKFRGKDGAVDSAKLLEAYTALEAKMGKPAVEAPVVAPAIPAGVDMAALNAEYAKDGALSDATYATLAAKNVTKATVDAYIAGQTALAEKYQTTLSESVGGKEALGKLIEWAGVNLTDAEIKSANKALQSMDADSAKLVLAGLQAKRIAAVGSDPALVGGIETTPVTGGVQAYRSNEEVVAAIGDKRYRADPAYRKDVENRLRVTQTFGR